MPPRGGVRASVTKARELLLTPKQRLAALLYLGGHMPARTLLRIVEGAPELVLLRLDRAT